MAAPGTVVTLREIFGAGSEMRLKLKKKTESLVDSSRSCSDENDDSKESDFDDENEMLIKQIVKNLAEKTKADLEKAQGNIKDLQAPLDEKAKQEALKRNRELFDAITEKTLQRIRRTGQIMIDETVKLPPHVQPEVLTFWECAQDLFNGVWDWLSGMFNYVLQKIREGFRIAKNAIKGLFETVCRFLGNMFKKKERKSEKQQKNM